MRRKNEWRWLLLMGFAFAFLSAAISFQGTNQPVTYEELKKTNVSLEIAGFSFASGLRPDAKGNANGNGVELVEDGWSGSGFIIDGDGSIITNYHVARRALGGRAIFEDGSQFDINQIKSYDPINDIAVLKIKAQKTFPTAKMGDSDSVNVMDRVLAVGNALNQRMAVTEGIINQVFVDDNNIRYQLRHSATIAPGNSGGALYRGSEVIGINVRGITGYSIYYSIPINLAKPLLDPKYPWVPLTQAFPANIEAILKRGKQIFSQNSQVPAGNAKEAGAKGFSLDVYPLEDLLFLVKSPGRDLAIMAVEPQQGKPIGLGDLRGPDAEVLLMSNENLFKMVVWVMNYDKIPANFALTAYRIEW